MNFGISAIVGVCLFVLPGALALITQSYKKSSQLTFSVNRELFIAIYISIGIHLFMLPLIGVLKFLPPVDFGFVFQIFTGTGWTDNLEMFNYSVPYFGAYLIALFVVSAVFGYLLSLRGFMFVDERVGITKNLIAGTDKIWSVVDVLTNSDVLYRGIYHSLSIGDAYCPEPTIDLMFVSRWSKGMPPPGGSSDCQEHKSGFRNILSYVNETELKEIIRGGQAVDGDDEFEKLLSDVVAAPVHLDELLRRSLFRRPEFHILWKDVKNINVRYVDLKKTKDE